jgi:hypothetical protein
MTRPGDRIGTIASRLFEPETMERVFEPILADLQCEYGEALAQGRRWRARLSLVRSYFAFGRALFSLGMRAACNHLIDTPSSEVASMCIVSTLVSTIVTIVLMIPPLASWRWWQGDPAFGALLSVTLIPQALPLSIPAGLCVAVLWANRGKVVTWRRLGTLLTIVIAVTVVVWIVLEWMMPHGNQAFREVVAARLAVDGRALVLEPGLNELGLSRLGQRTDPAAVRHYYLLWALCFAPASLSLLALAMAGHVRRAALAVALAIALSTSYFACIWIATVIPSGPGPPAFVQAWTPNTLFVLVACALLVRSQRPRAV